MNFACSAGGTLPRSELELNRQLDLWSGFGLPLVVGISVPSGDGADAKARQKRRTFRRLLGRVELGTAAELGGPLRAAAAGQAGHLRRDLEPVRGRAAARVSPRRARHAARAGQARAAHAGGAAGGAD